MSGGSAIHATGGQQYLRNAKDRAGTASAIKPSVGESVIEGMRQLNLKDGPSSQDSDSNKENMPDKTMTVETTGLKDDTDTITPTAAEFPAPPVSSPPRKPTGYRKQDQKTAPVIRQTKTSAMRMRLSTGSMEESEHPAEKKVKTAGPVRSKSRLRHMATGRGSPYTIPARSPSRSSDGPRAASTDSNDSRWLAQAVMVKEPKSSDNAKRKTSIPLPSRLIRHFPNEESEADISQVKHRRASFRSSHSEVDPSDADVDTDHIPGNVSSAKSSTSHHRLTPHVDVLLNQPSGSFLTFSELMATPAPTERELNSEHDSAQGSLHGHDENGGFKIKKLRGRASQGTTLRISDSAQQLLAPKDDDDQDEPDARGRRNSMVLKDHLRKPSDLIKSHIQLTRSLTERSLALLSSAPAAKAKDDGAKSPSDEGEYVGDSSIIIKRELSADNRSEKTPVGDELQDVTRPGNNGDGAAGTPSSFGQGDWPLKDFKTLASASKEHSARDSIDSSWIPPADWEVRKSLDLSTLDFSSPPMHVPQNTPVKVYASRNHFSSPVPPFGRPPQPPGEPDDDIPPPTPEKDSIFKRKFPPRTTSKQKVPQFVLSGRDRNLSPVHEASEQNLSGHLQRKDYGPTPSRIAQPKYMRSFTQSIRDIDDGFKAVKQPNPPSRGSNVPAHTKSSGKKSLSTFRSLFHKKSGDIRGSLRAKRTRPAIDTSQISSPLLATPTPLPNEVQACDFHRSAEVPNPASAPMPPKAAAMLGQQVPASAPAKFDIHFIESLEIRDATQTALRLLDMARDERLGSRQNQLVEVSLSFLTFVNTQ